MKDKLRILLRIALVLLLVCGVTVGVLYVNRDVGIPTDQHGSGHPGRLDGADQRR